MTSYSERLAYLITANGDDAVKTFQKVGKSAETELGRANTGATKLGSTFTKVGAGMVAFAGVAAAGLDRLARQAEQSEHAQLLLNNTLANSPQLVGQSAKQFDDLATAIQNKTAADNKAIVAGIATLGNFNLTAVQLKTLTPLLVDYAARTGKEVPDAASDLGKALLGNSRALKAIGVDFKNTGDSTANYNELVQALRDKVGGFAEDEGKTFSGSIQRLKNQLNDLEAGVGVGVVDAFTKAVKPIGEFSGWLAKTSPEGQKLTGELLAIGTAAIGAVGGLSFIGGQLAKLHSRFVETEGSAAGTLTTLGKFAAGVGIAAGIAGIAVSLAELNKQSNQVTVNVREMARATNEQLGQAFEALAKGPNFGGGNISLKVFKKLAEDSIGTAQRMRDAVAAAGGDVSKLDKILKSEATAQRQANRDAQAGASAVDDLGTSADTAAASTDNLAASLDKLKGASLGIGDAQDAVTKSLLSLQDEATKASQSRQDALDREKETAQSLADTEDQVAQRISDAQDQVSQAREDAGKINHPGQQRDEANKRLADAQKSLGRAQREGDQEIARAHEAVKKAAEDVKKATDEWTPSLDRATTAGLKNRDAFDGIVDSTFKAVEEMKKEGKPASEIAAYISNQRQDVEAIAIHLGFAREQLKQYLDLLSGARTLEFGGFSGLAHFRDSLTPSPVTNTTGAVYNTTVNVQTNAEPNAIADAIERSLRRRG